MTDISFVSKKLRLLIIIYTYELDEFDHMISFQYTFYIVTNQLSHRPRVINL